MTKTPLTDAAYKQYQGLVKAHIASGPLLETSRSLELSLSQAREERDRLAAALQAMFDCYEGVWDMSLPKPHQSENAKLANETARALLAQHAVAKEGK